MEPSSKLKVVYRKTADLTPYDRNARTHSPEQVERIAASIREFGFTNPVLVDGQSGVIAGHGRILAAQQLGMATVPTIELAGLSEAQKRAYIIADNKLALDAGWDIDILAAEFASLEELDYDLSLTGFSPDDVADIEARASARASSEDDDNAPEASDNPVSRRGDVWFLGPHRVMCGDATAITDVEALCDGQRVDLLLTDPPYNVAYEGGTKARLKIQNDAMADDAFRQFLRDAFVTADAVMKPGAVFYIWHSDSEAYNFRGAANDANWKVRQCLIWKKSSMVMGRQDYQWQHEPCLYGWKGGGGHLWASDRKQTTILEFDRPSRNADHPTMKPVALFEYQMLNNTKGGDIVLDPFGGSGTTLIAAEKNGRHARVLELDPVYCDVILRRWQEYTGEDARLGASDGPTWLDLQESGRA